jgi:hypothetical protein
MRRAMFLAIVVAGFCLPISAQDVLMGGIAAPRSFTQLITSGPVTYVDLARPANGAGSLTHAVVRWFNSCTPAFRLKFIRPSGTNLNVFAERGPFGSASALNTLNDIALNPPVTVQRGDLIGVTYIATSTTCLLPVISSSPREVLIRVNGDPAVGTNLTGISYEFGQGIDVRASTSISVVGAIIPAAGAATGVGNSQFKTDVQLSNNTFVLETGRFIYHRAQVPGTSSDPFLAYSVPSGASVLISDVVGKMGISGVGSIDIMPSAGDLPVASVRVYTDGGPDGTSGFTEEVFPPDLALRANDYVALQPPADQAKFRMNVGVRTLGEGATISVGDSPAKSYPANYFEQVPLSTFIGNTPIPASGFIGISITAGRLFIYASTTDNKTNDSAIKFLSTSNNQ